VRSPAWVFWLYLITWIPYAACLALYGLRSPWRESKVGRAMFALFASMTAVLTLAVVARVVDLSPLFREAWALVTLSCVALAGFGLLAAIVRLQRRDVSDRSLGDRSVTNRGERQ
jgi:peptidoglycan/LPS O-acetylase OafA/YrhL